MPDHDATTPDLPEVYTLASIEQLRAFADELRVRIFIALTQRPLTATQLGDELDIAAPKAHYHVRELERVGLVRLVETRERGGILEKYFRAVAKDVQVPHALLRRTPDESQAIIRDQLQHIERGFTSAFSRTLAADELGDTFIQLTYMPLWATRDELRDLVRRFEELTEPYLAPRPDEGVRQRMFVMMGYDAGLEESAPPAEEAEPAQAAPAPGQAPAGHAPRTRPVSVAGVVSYTRRDLERVVATGEALDLRVVGACIIADDVSAELAERAIAHLRLRGTLTAPPEVRTVLENKQSPQQRKEV